MNKMDYVERSGSERRLDLVATMIEYEEKESHEKGSGLVYLTNNYAHNPKFIDAVITISSIDIANSDSPISIFEDKAKRILHNQDENNYIGEQIEKWVIQESLSTNSKSLVFKASHSDYSAEVAIKITSPIYQSYIGNNQGAKQAHYMSQSAHPNLVTVLSAGITSSGASYVVMELLTGLNIVEHCIKNNLSFADRIGLFRQVCNCVANLHVNLVVHSDIKPANIILDQHGSPKLLDFDLSHSTNTEFHQDYDYIDVAGHSRVYAAPEQIKNNQSSPLSDIYNLGILLFEILDIGDNESSNAEKISSLTIRYSTNSRWIEMLAILEKATSEQLVNRYQTVNELSNDLSCLENNEVIVSSYKGEASKWYKTKFSLRRSRRVIALFALISIMVSASVGFVLSEKFEKHRAVALLLDSHNPETSGIKDNFDQQAQRALNETYLFKDKEFEELMSWGRAYYGKGKATKAKPFFIKAQSLYEDTKDEYIDSTTYLVLSYYRMGEIDIAFDLVQALLPVFMRENLNNMTTIRLFFTALEVDSKFKKDLFEGYELDDIDNVLDSIDIESLPESEQAGVKAFVTFYKAINDYYAILTGDYVSKAVLIDEIVFKTEVKPELLRLRALMMESLAGLITTNERHYLIPQVKAWIGHISNQLRDYESARIYSDAAVEETISMFGVNHPRTIEVYIKRFGTFRYYDLVLSHKAAQKSADIILDGGVKNISYPYFPWVLLSSSHLVSGDNVKSLDVTKQLIEIFESSKAKMSEQVQLQTVYNIITALIDHTLFLPEDYISDWVRSSYNKYLPVLLELSGESTNDFPVYMNRTYSLSDGRTNEWFINISNEIIKYYEEYDPVVLPERYLKFGLACLSYEKCEAEKFIKGYKSTRHYSAYDMEFSIEYLADNTNFSRLLMGVGRYQEANNVLDTVADLMNKQTFKLSYHRSLWHLTKAKFYIHINNYEAAAKHLDLAKPGGIYNFGVKSEFMSEISRLEGVKRQYTKI